jgi:hypothetical protein
MIMEKLGFQASNGLPVQAEFVVIIVSIVVSEKSPVR